MPPISLKREFAGEGLGETRGPTGNVETPMAGQGNERPRAMGLMEAVVERGNLLLALRRVKQNKGGPGIDGMTVGEIEAHLREYWIAIWERLLSGSYRPSPVKRLEIPKSGGGERELGIPTVLDRFIQQAILQILQPQFPPLPESVHPGSVPG